MEAIRTTSTSLPSLPKLDFRRSRRLSLRINTSNRSEIRGISSSSQFIKFSSPSVFPLLASHGFRSEPKASGVRCSAAADTSAFVSDNSPSELPAKFFGVEVSTLKKVIPLGLMFFCILFNYTILRDTKDVLVVTAKGSSAETIPFLKTWVNLPAAIGFMIIYSKLSNVLSKEALFYACMFPFIAFFGVFAFLLYPNINVIHPIALADRLLEILGPSFLGPIAILRIWSFCIFYVMSELWGSVVVSLLFWGYANQITTVDEASQFYPLFGLGANVALVFSGRTVKYFSNLRKNFGPGVDGWAISLKGMMSIVVALGLLICGIYWGMNRYIKTEGGRKKKKEKTKMGTMESMKFLLSSRYIRDLATLVVAYGISINLVEITWKSKLKSQFPTPNEYSAFMGDFSSCTGVATFTMMLLSRFIFRKFGWGVAAAITPTVLLVTGIAFFSLILFSDPLGPVFGNLGLTPLLAAVYVGAVQNIFSKSAKYSLFDPCKEMAYIPLDEETKVKGKAAIDVVCNPLGKSGGALIQQFLILTFGSLSNSTPYLGGILLVIVLAWLGAARSLDRQFTPMVKKDLKDKLIEGKISAINTRLTGKLEPKQGIRYRFVSTLNPMGFIEGKYVPVVENISSSGGIQHLTVRKLDGKNQLEQPVETAIQSTGAEGNNHDGNGHVSPESPSENEIPSESS
ncbi:ADP,ATP carrier protein 1, chloroplastic-like [Macadamia integrifolia]|uniref:ADP,ATP carrier protein 1, chloroplastic-like n=1 Tax=Macadamia integrifolia TaxID=60698 RepID=UPI001C4E4579|nr:ADP,ATP carrier protein 1, chloroplastic-like [Macadamia integrifolia]